MLSSLSITTTPVFFRQHQRRRIHCRAHQHQPSKILEPRKVYIEIMESAIKRIGNMSVCWSIHSHDTMDDDNHDDDGNAVTYVYVVLIIVFMIFLVCLRHEDS